MQLKNNFNNIKLFPNQKFVLSHREHMGIDFSSTNSAMQRLSPKTYMIYMYLLTRSGRVPWILSAKNVAENTTLEESDLEWALQELRDKNYLVPGEITFNGHTYNENCYHLWEAPSSNPDYSPN